MSSLISTTQRQKLLNEASRKAIKNSQLKSLPEILDDLVGVRDIGQSVYGLPLAPLYIAKSNELIDVSRMGGFFTGLSRDFSVLDTSLSNIETSLSLMNLEIWSKMELLKNRATILNKRALQEKSRSSSSATWSYTETFNTTTNIDTQNTTAWIDTSEGVAYLPALGHDLIIKPTSITVTNQILPTGGNLLGSNPNQAFDGLPSTNWRCVFAVDDNSKASTTTVFDLPYDITSITIDPIGFGVQVIVEADSGTGFNQLINSIIYSKTTFIAHQLGVQKIKLSYLPAHSVLPKIVGIGDITFYIAKSAKEADVISKILTTPSAFSQLKLSYNGVVPHGTKLNAYYILSENPTLWNEINVGDWLSVYSSSDVTLHVNPNQASNLPEYRGLYGIPLTNSNPPITVLDGLMNIGHNQVEVSSFNYDWRQVNQAPKILSSQDFDNRIITTAWCKADNNEINNTQFVIQQKSQSDIINNTILQRGGDSLLFQRKSNYSFITTQDYQYKHLCIVPLINNSTNTMQYNFNYRIKYYVYSPIQWTYNNARYWMFQGYRQTGKRGYKELGKTFCTLAMNINDSTVIADSSPYTIYSDDSIESAGKAGNSFNITMNSGWNKVEIFLSVINPNVYGVDYFDSQYPYFQITMTPSLFDTTFSQDPLHPISVISASGPFKPISEFDLLWNVPIQPTFWAWSEDRQNVLFNTKQMRAIDGYFNGVSPECVVNYTGSQTGSSKEVQVKFHLERDVSSNLTPLLNDYTLMVR